MGETYLGIYVLYLGLLHWKLSDWIASFLRECHSFFWSMGFDSTAEFIRGVKMSVGGTTGFFVTAFVLTLLTAMMISTTSVKRLENESRGYY